MLPVLQTGQWRASWKSSVCRTWSRAERTVPMSIAPKRIGGFGEYEANLGLSQLSHTFPYFPYKNGSQFVTWSFSIFFGSFLCVLLFFSPKWAVYWPLRLKPWAPLSSKANFATSSRDAPQPSEPSEPSDPSEPRWPIRHDIDLTVVDQVANAIHLTNLRRTLRSLRIQCSPLSTWL